MTKSKFTIRLLLFIRFALLLGLFLYLGFWLMIIMVLSAGTFNLTLSFIAYPVFAIATLVFVTASATRRYAKRFYALFFLVFFGVVGVRATYLHFDAKVPVLSDGVNIADYRPFSPALPRLPEDSRLKLESELPVLDGALALYPVYSAFATAVYPEKSYELTGRAPGRRANTAYYDGSSQDSEHKGHEVHFTNTVDGFTGLLDGRVDIYFMADISDEQKEQAARQGVELVYTPIGREAFVFFVNADNPVESLTVEQIRAIYSGKITSWSKLGGQGAIKPFQRNKNSGSQSALEHFMKGEPLIEPPTTERPAGMGGIIRQVADYKNYTGAIGFSFRFFSTHMVANRQIRLLKIDGVAPVKENISNGTYPLSSYFYAITRKDNKNRNIRKMLEFMTSGQGQYLVEQVGYVPVMPASDPMP